MARKTLKQIALHYMDAVKKMDPNLKLEIFPHADPESRIAVLDGWVTLIEDEVLVVGDGGNTHVPGVGVYYDVLIPGNRMQPDDFDTLCLGSYRSPQQAVTEAYLHVVANALKQALDSAGVDLMYEDMQEDAKLAEEFKKGGA